MQGEAYMPGYGSPGFVAYLSSLSIADGNQNRHATQEKTDLIKSGITRDMQERNQTIEFEP